LLGGARFDLPPFSLPPPRPSRYPAPRFLFSFFSFGTLRRGPAAADGFVVAGRRHRFPAGCPGPWTGLEIVPYVQGALPPPGPVLCCDLAVGPGAAPPPRGAKPAKTEAILYSRSVTFEKKLETPTVRHRASERFFTRAGPVAMAYATAGPPTSPKRSPAEHRPARSGRTLPPGRLTDGACPRRGRRLLAGGLL